jgi:hypothetical protein
MKTFFATLAAILVAAAIIGTAVGIYRANERETRDRVEIQQLALDSEIHSAQREWERRMNENPQYDPKAEKLSARLREIKQANESGKTAPEWQK